MSNHLSGFARTQHVSLLGAVETERDVDGNGGKSIELGEPIRRQLLFVAVLVIQFDLVCPNAVVVHLDHRRYSIQDVLLGSHKQSFVFTMARLQIGQRIDAHGSERIVQPDEVSRVAAVMMSVDLNQKQNMFSVRYMIPPYDNDRNLP